MTVLKFGDIILFVAIVVVSLFILGYAVLAPKWMRHASGRLLMSATINVDLLLFLSFSNTYLNSWYVQARPWVRLAAYLSTMVVFVFFLQWLWHGQWRATFHVPDRFKRKAHQHDGDTDL